MAGKHEEYMAFQREVFAYCREHSTDSLEGITQVAFSAAASVTLRDGQIYQLLCI